MPRASTEDVATEVSHILEGQRGEMTLEQWKRKKQYED